MPDPLPHADTDPTATDAAAPEAGYALWLTATAGLAASTARTYTGHLGDYTRWWSRTHPTRSMTAADPGDVEAYLAHLASRGLRASTRRTALHALRAYYRWLDRDKTLPAGRHNGTNPAVAVRRPRVPKPRTVVYSPSEADAILAVARLSATHDADHGRRSLVTPWPTVTTEADPLRPGGCDGFDHAVLATLRWTGTRSSELCGLNLTDLTDGGLLHIHGKGSKHRTVPLPPTLAPILHRYLACCRAQASATGGAVPERLFLNPASPSLNLTPRALLEVCRRHGAAAGVAGPHRPLRWRHTYATHTLALGVDLHSLSRLLGHTSVTSSERYLHLDTADLQVALARAYTTPSSAAPNPTTSSTVTATVPDHVSRGS